LNNGVREFIILYRSVNLNKIIINMLQWWTPNYSFQDWNLCNHE